MVGWNWKKGVEVVAERVVSAAASDASYIAKAFRLSGIRVLLEFWQFKRFQIEKHHNI